MNVERVTLKSNAFMNRFNASDAIMMKYYDDYLLNEKSIKRKIETQPHPHTEQLANIIESDMKSYGVLSTPQKDSLNKLKTGHKVIIGGQQAGLFMSPSYIVHKIFTIITLQHEVKDKYGYEAVPVFWVAGEDHDFEEVNHTFVYDEYYKKLKKIMYKPNLTVPMSMGFYKYDKKAMHDTLNKLMVALGDHTHHVKLKEKMHKFIDEYTYWTELFHAIVNDVFKEYGVLIFNSHLKEVRQLEKPFFKMMIEQRDKVHQSFKDGQASFNRTFNLSPMIETESNAHLFVNATTHRSLVTFNEGEFKTSNGQTFTPEALLKYLDEKPEDFSTNVVTRPLMQEKMFNTLIFVGGNAEVQYWGELHALFQAFNVEMPIIAPRMNISIVSKHIQKLMNTYQINDSNINYDLNARYDEYVRTAIDENLIQMYNELKETIESKYEAIEDYVNDNHSNFTDVNHANKKKLLKELEYIKRRFHVEQMQSITKERKEIKEIQSLLLPQSVLQERKIHPFQFLMFLEELPKLKYSTDHTIVKI